MIEALPERFWSKIKTSVGGCWEWTAFKQNKGYGRFSMKPYQLAHRIMHDFYFKKETPPSTMILHSCDNPSCVNPRHLSQGDHVENNKQRDNRGRQVAKRGEEHWKAVLTVDQVREIRASRESNQALARKFPVTKSAIGNIRRWRSWRHVT